MEACGGWACLVDPRYHVVLALKVCALAGRALAACGRLRTLTAALCRGAPVSGNPARHRPEFAMSLSSTSSVVAVDALLVRDVDGQYRPARSEEVLSQARRVLSQRVRRGLDATLRLAEAGVGSVQEHNRRAGPTGARKVRICVSPSDITHFKNGPLADGSAAFQD